MSTKNARESISNHESENSNMGIKFGFDTILEEYRKVNSQMEFFHGVDDRSFDVTFVVMGIVVVGSSFIMQQKAYSLFLLLALPFYIISWIQIRRGILSNHHANYVRTVIVPQLKYMLANVQQDKDTKSASPQNFVFWEEYILSLTNKFGITGIAMSFPYLGRIILQFSIALLLVTAYLGFRANDSQYYEFVFDIVGIGLNALFIFMSIIAVIAFLKFPKGKN